MKNSSKKSGLPAGRRAYKISAKRLKITGIMCLAAVLISLICISPIFSIKTIYVKGNNHISSEEVLAAAKIKKGDNIFSLDTSKISENIEKLPRAGGAVIQRTLPGRVDIVVNEVSEAAYIKTKTAYAGIDKNGKVIVMCKNTELEAPLVSGMKIAEPTKGAYIKCEDKEGKKKTETLTTLLGELSDRSLIKLVKSVNIKDLKNISMTLTTDTVVNLGEDGKDSEDSLEYKIAFLKAILDKDPPKGGGIIELSDTSNVTSRIS